MVWVLSANVFAAHGLPFSVDLNVIDRRRSAIESGNEFTGQSINERHGTVYSVTPRILLSRMPDYRWCTVLSPVTY
jgi:hypothetical protein